MVDCRMKKTIKMKKTIEIEVCDICEEDGQLWECEICGKMMCSMHYRFYDEPHLTFPDSCFCEDCYNKVWKEYKKIVNRLKQQEADGE